MIKAALLTIGDEILIGQIVDTNSSWLGQELTQYGIDVHTRFSVGDDLPEIVDALALLGSKHDLVVVTGGLGPTKDDVTKQAMCSFFETKLAFDQGTYQWIEELFASFGRIPMEVHRQQAFHPVGCDLLANQQGTAPGMHMEKDGTHYVFMPGVPYEMKHIFKNQVLGRMRAWYDIPPIQYITLHTVGQGESYIADQVEDLEAGLPKGMKLAYLPGTGRVRLRLLLKGHPGKEGLDILEREAAKFEERLGGLIYGRNGDRLEEVVGRLLKEKGMNLTLAESCTGGQVAHLITSVPGASEYFVGSLVSYSNDLKMKELGVSKEVLREHGAVSEPVVKQMASGALNRYGADIALSISGIAGPEGGSPEKPVGTVWMAVTDGEVMKTRKFTFGKQRQVNIEYAAYTGLNMIRKFLLAL
jgi:nicotinamide-nucleotide amidase